MIGSFHRAGLNDWLLDDVETAEGVPWSIPVAPVGGAWGMRFRTDRAILGAVAHHTGTMPAPNLRRM